MNIQEKHKEALRKIAKICDEYNLQIASPDGSLEFIFEDGSLVHNYEACAFSRSPNHVFNHSRTFEFNE